MLGNACLQVKSVQNVQIVDTSLIHFEIVLIFFLSLRFIDVHVFLTIKYIKPAAARYIIVNFHQNIPIQKCLRERITKIHTHKLSRL